jgi:putative phosphoesterase
MKILVVSDLHGKYHEFLILLEKVDFDICIVLGDFCFDNSYIKRKYPTTIFIKGNCDYAGYSIDELFITLDSTKMFLTHGHKYQVKSLSGIENLYDNVYKEDVKLVLYGHTHIFDSTYYKNILFVNPGAFIDKDYIIIENNIIKREKWTE